MSMNDCAWLHATKIAKKIARKKTTIGARLVLASENRNTQSPFLFWIRRAYG